LAQSNARYGISQKVAEWSHSGFTQIQKDLHEEHNLDSSSNNLMYREYARTLFHVQK
jgi:hypothetical protein